MMQKNFYLGLSEEALITRCQWQYNRIRKENLAAAILDRHMHTLNLQ